MDITSLSVEKLGLLGVLGTIIVTGFKRYWVFGWYYTALERDRDYWKNAALELGALGTQTASAIRRRLEQEA